MTDRNNAPLPCSVHSSLAMIWLWLGSRNRRVLFVDVCMLLFSVYLGYALRLTFFMEGDRWKEMALAAVCFTATITAVFAVGKIYITAWPQASVEEYARLFRCYLIGTAIFLAEKLAFSALVVPRSSLAIIILAAILFLAGARASWRLLLVYRSHNADRKKRALIIGAGEAGTLIARDILRHDSSIQPIAFIDDNPAKKGLLIASLPVLGGKEALPMSISDNLIDTVLIAIPTATGEQLRSYLDLLTHSSVTVRVLPGVTDLADGQVSTTRLRNVRLEDLLRREPVKLDCTGIEKLVSGKTVLVTGAGGSIGSEICRQVLARKPKRLIALGHGEQSIYLLMESLKDAGVTIPVQPVIADVADPVTMRNVFEKHRPQIVFHAGAHKHVPLMEENPREALRVNSFGTWNLASLAGEYGAERMVMISTDKAVHPTSVMGATKRIAERLLLSVQSKYPNTLYVAVRFGNVLGSRGSVVPKFEKQIENGGPVTVTHKDMKRYFMLIPEAVSLVLQAGTMGSGGELFVLDMGEPVNITEMAETLIKLHGHEPYKDIKIEFTGIRPGEKLYEELFYDPAHVDKTAHKKIFLTKMSAGESVDLIKEVANNMNGMYDKETVRSGIFKLAEI